MASETVEWLNGLTAHVMPKQEKEILDWRDGSVGQRHLLPSLPPEFDPLNPHSGGNQSLSVVI